MFNRRIGTLVVSAVAVAFPGGLPAAETVVESFDRGAVALEWQIVNDSVMGGVSRSGLERVDDEVVRFRGQLRLENNGGFASVRASGRLPDLTRTKAMMIRVKGDGRTYQLRLRTSDGWRTPDYSAEFATEAGKWQTHLLPLSEFVAGWRGRAIRNAPPVEPSDIRSVGILLGDKKPGAFSIDIDWIKALIGRAAGESDAWES
ncbi:CIA30 family protein [Opitutaceae bacterium]|nr:CIA30 family protein [Opitutaceae bacterium]